MIHHALTWVELEVPVHEHQWVRFLMDGYEGLALVYGNGNGLWLGCPSAQFQELWNVTEEVCAAEGWSMTRSGTPEGFERELTGGAHVPRG